VAIEVVNRQRSWRIDSQRIADLATATLRAVGRPLADVTIGFVSDRTIRRMNKQFRDYDRATDVLSFPATNNSEQTVGNPLSEFLGDIVISAETASRQADEAGHSLEREIDELLIHGVLHLCGHDHESDHGEMNRLELRLRRKLLG